MRLRVGTSGYSYKEWKGSFYPDDLPPANMLPFYASRFDTVEINNTFYRMPDAKTLAKWAGEVPDGFTFVLKAPQRITHQKRLAGAGDDVRRLFDAASSLGEKLGPVLFQLPPFLRKDTARLASFLDELPEGREVAFEFRHHSWMSEDVYEILRSRDAALCAAQTDETRDPDAIVVPTAGWGYVRLRSTGYTDADLAGWVMRIGRQPWQTAYVFFKHEEEGKGPEFAGRFLAAWNK
ncbi:MAG TPA: DUF72 domain-containing protein [Thermoanaerobaculia bacterium]|nr:DUF72 domain-containing protein [Thermoanaerobaculia bacterium]